MQCHTKTSATLQLFLIKPSNFVSFPPNSFGKHRIWACRHILFQVAAGLKALPPPGPGRPEESSQMASDNASAATQLDKVSSPLLGHLISVCIAYFCTTQRGALSGICQRHHAAFELLFVVYETG